MQPPALPARTGAGIVIVIDSTGVRVSHARGWHQDRPYARDMRRTRYLKLHLAIDADTGAPIAWDLTRAAGPRTGDASLAPAVISQAADLAAAHGSWLCGGIGDGAYDATPIYTRMRARGGPWLCPIPDGAVRGRHDDRDRHITGIARLGHVYLERAGYHQRSTIEAANGAMKRTVHLATRAKDFERQGTEIAWQLHTYTELLHHHGR